MHVRPKTVTKLVKVMKDPDPRFVSMVDHGANQTPFRVVKRVTPLAGQTFAAKADKEPYGDVEYADPGYQEDGKKRYPIDTEEHVRAAWSYINQSSNADKYSAQELSRIKSKIKSAGEKFGIDFEDDSKAEKSAMPVTAKKSEAPAQSDLATIRSLIFKKAHFPTASNVKKWLDDGQYDGFVIVDKGDAYLVEGENVTDDMFTGSLRIIKMDEDERVVATVGTLADVLAEGDPDSNEGVAKPIQGESGATGTAADLPNNVPQDQNDGGGSHPAVHKAAVKGVRPVKKSAAVVTKENTKKWDWWMSYSSGEFDLQGVIAAAMTDGVPPGVCQVMDAVSTAMSNVLKTDDLDIATKEASLKTIGEQFASITFKLYQVFAALPEDTALKFDKQPALKAWCDETNDFLKTGTVKMNTYGDNEGPVTPKSPQSGEGDNPNDDKGAVVGDTDKDKIEVPDNGGEPLNTAAQTNTAAVKANGNKPRGGAKDGGANGNTGDQNNNDGDDDDMAKKIATAVGAAVGAALEPVMKRMDEIDDKVTAVKGETEQFSRRAPTKKAASSAGSEEMISDPVVAKKAADEAEATRKFDRRMVRNSFGLVTPMSGRV